MAVMPSVYLPGVSFLVRDSRPAKRTVEPGVTGEGQRTALERALGLALVAPVHRDALAGGLAAGTRSGEVEAHGGSRVERVLDGGADRRAPALI